MANVRTRGTDKVKVVSAVITLAVIVALVFGIFSVAQNVKKSKNNNLVNLNETEGNVAIKTDDDPDIPVEEPTVGDDDIINANARDSYLISYMLCICTIRLREILIMTWFQEHLSLVPRQQQDTRLLNRQSSLSTM